MRSQVCLLVLSERCRTDLPECCANALTLQAAGVSEGLDVSDLVDRAIVPPVGRWQVSAARSLQDEKDGPNQHPQPAEPEQHQQRPTGPHPAEGTWRAIISSECLNACT